MIGRCPVCGRLGGELLSDNDTCGCGASAVRTIDVNERLLAGIRAAGATACQVETGLGCHLDAHQIHDALHHLYLGDGAAKTTNVDEWHFPSVGYAESLGHDHRRAADTIAAVDKRRLTIQRCQRLADGFELGDDY